MFITIKRRAITIFLCALIVLVGIVVYFTAIRQAVVPKATHVVVIDAGHGGRDVKLGL